MEAKFIEGNIIKITDKKLTLQTAGSPPGEETYPHEGLNIDEEWIKRFLGTAVRCTLINGVIKVIRPFSGR